MTIYRFEINNCIDVEIESENQEDARMILVDNPSLFQDKMIEDCCISNGIEVIL